MFDFFGNFSFDESLSFSDSFEYLFFYFFFDLLFFIVGFLLSQSFVIFEELNSLFDYIFLSLIFDISVDQDIDVVEFCQVF